MPTAEDMAASSQLTDDILDFIAANDASPYVGTVALLNALGFAIRMVAEESDRDPVRESQWWARHLCNVVKMNAAKQNAPRAGERRH
jgi:hypothetical protein